MKKDMLRVFEAMPYFTIEGFKQAAGIESPQTARVLLHRWAQAGHILAIKKGVYMSSRFHDQHRQDAEFSAAVSAILLPNSYISLEYILQQHNLLTETTYPVTCITPRNTRTITNPLGTFWYRHIRPDWYRGFTLTEYFGIRYATANLAKALFDYLYLRPIPAAFNSLRFDLAEELRLNLDEVDAESRDVFAGWVETSDSPKMRAILTNFRSHVWQP